MKRVALLILFSMPFLSYTQDKILEEYLKTGLESNLALKQKMLDYSISIESLKQSKSLFYPDINLNARYTVAQGGRTIDFPVGDLLNPVYSTLNILTMSQNFPQIDNQEFSFYRPTEHETKLSLVQPIFNPAIYHNYHLTKMQSQTKLLDASIYKHELIKEIKTAYYNYQKTLEMNRLLDSTMVLLEENVRVNKSLFKNNKITKDAVLRSEAELSSVLIKKAEVEKSKNMASAWLNFLLNRPLTTPIAASHIESPIKLYHQLDTLKTLSRNIREELQLIDSYKTMNSNYLKIVKSGNYPQIFGAVDYGFQGEKYSFGHEDDFLLVSLVLKWNLFHGMETQSKKQEIHLQEQQLDMQREQAEKQIELQVIQCFYELQEASQKLISADKKEKASTEAFKIVRLRYAQGQANLLEYLDARTNMTNAQQEVIVIKYDYLIKEAELERALGTATGEF
ncbi:MAG: TolC family protein [Bacteroidales bacterium]|nr:TolC family protein [Bacteroidales bacterium]